MFFLKTGYSGGQAGRYQLILRCVYSDDVQCSGQRFALCDFDVRYFQTVREALFSRQSLRISASVTRRTGTCFVNLRFCNQFLKLVNSSFFTIFFFFSFFSLFCMLKQVLAWWLVRSLLRIEGGNCHLGWPFYRNKIYFYRKILCFVVILCVEKYGKVFSSMILSVKT